MMKPLYFHNDTWYQVIRVIKAYAVSNKNGVVNMEVLKGWRDYLGGDHVLRQNDVYLICETIPNIEWEDVVEDEPIEN